MNRAILLLWAAAMSAQVPYSRIRNAAAEPGNWLTYSGDYSGRRFSSLTEITPANVSRLKLKWIYQFEDTNTEVSPIVDRGVMYVSGPNTAAAIDVTTGRSLWKWKRPIPSDYRSIGFARVNRGPAILDDQLYVATLDCHLVALDIKSGQERWSTKVADYKTGYSMTMAPLALDGKIVVGISGGEAGVRGFIDAYDAHAGERLWRFWTVPGPGDPAIKTWAGESWEHAGGTTWVTGSYDPELNLLYWGTGNPGPDWNGDSRAGDNLYTCSLVALDASTGELRWHFQFTPHDVHDWDSTHVPVLFEAQINGRRRKLIANANRNAFYYLLDRETGEFLTGKQYAKQTWAQGLDSRGRPTILPGTEPSETGSLVWPSAYGATVWFSPSYSPSTQLFYVAVRESGSVYYKGEVTYSPGAFFTGGGDQEVPADDQWGAVRALDAKTGSQTWEFRLHSPPWAGVLSTAGGLVFSGSIEGNFFALDAATGKPLWDFQTGGSITANPIAFSIGGHQHIAITADRVLMVFGL